MWNEMKWYEMQWKNKWFLLQNKVIFSYFYSITLRLMNIVSAWLSILTFVAFGINSYSHLVCFRTNSSSRFDCFRETLFAYQKEVNECIQLGRYLYPNFSWRYLHLLLGKTLRFLEHASDLWMCACISLVVLRKECTWMCVCVILKTNENDCWRLSAVWMLYECCVSEMKEVKENKRKRKIV